MFNDLSRLSFLGTAVRLFNELAVVKIGGKVDVNENIYDYFNGIIAGECLINVLTLTWSSHNFTKSYKRMASIHQLIFVIAFVSYP